MISSNTSTGLNTFDPLAIVASLVSGTRLLKHLEGAYEASALICRTRQAF
jgi:hypothetical protein